MSLLRSSQLVKIIWNGRKIIIVIVLVSLALGLIFENFRSPSWKTIVPIVIASKEEQNTPDFNYDHYYSLQASDILTDSLEEFLKTNSTKNIAKSESKVQFRSSSWVFWESESWSVKKKAPQLVEVSFYTPSDKSAAALEKSLKNQVNSFLESFNQTGKPYFSLTNSTSSVEFQAPRWGLISILSILWGIIVGIIVVLEKENLRQRKEDLL